MILKARNINDGLIRSFKKVGNKIQVTRHGGIEPSEFLVDQSGYEKLFVYRWFWEVLEEEPDREVVVKPKKTGFEGELEVREKKASPNKVVQGSLL